MKKVAVSLVSMIPAIAFILIALFGPWWGYQTTVSYETYQQTTQVSASLTSLTTIEDNNIQTQSYKDLRAQAEKNKTNVGRFDVFNNTLFMTIALLVTAILALFCIIGYIFEYGKAATMKKLGGIFGVITFILMFVTVIYFMLVLPPEMGMKTYEGGEMGFWYSMTMNGNDYLFSAGPGYSWYLMLVSSILVLSSTIIIMLDKADKKLR